MNDTGIFKNEDGLSLQVRFSCNASERLTCEIKSGEVDKQVFWPTN